jgi:hypothetical protein
MNQQTGIPRGIPDYRARKRINSSWTTLATKTNPDINWEQGTFHFWRDCPQA